MNMLNFFKAWIKSADTLIKGQTPGQDHLPVDTVALCGLTGVYFQDSQTLKAHKALKDMLARHTPGGDYPFQSGKTYTDKYYDFHAEQGLHHLNPRRQAFVEEMIQRLEDEQ